MQHTYKKGILYRKDDESLLLDFSGRLMPEFSNMTTANESAGFLRYTPDPGFSRARGVCLFAENQYEKQCMQNNVTVNKILLFIAKSSDSILSFFCSLDNTKLPSFYLLKINTNNRAYKTNVKTANDC